MCNRHSSIKSKKSSEETDEGESYVKKKSKIPTLVVQSGTVVEINHAWVDFFSYSEEEILGLNITDIFHLLRTGPDFEIHSFSEQNEYFIFTKLLEAKFVRIKKETKDGFDFFYFKENRTESLLRKHNYLYSLILNNISSISVYSAPDLTLLISNSKELAHFRHPYKKPEGVYGKKIHEFMENFSGSIIENGIKKAISTGKPTKLNKSSYYASSGLNTYYNTLITPIVNKGILKFIVIQTEELPKVKHIIKQQKELLETIFDNMADAVTVYDKDGDLQFYNAQAKNLYENISRNSSVEKLLKEYEFYDLKGVPIHHDNLPTKRALKGEQIHNERVLLKRHGKSRYIEISSIPIYDETNHILSVFTSYRDITSDIEWQNTIERQKKQLEIIIENISGGIAVVDKNGRFLLKNKMFDTILHNDEISPYQQICNIEGLPCERILVGEKIVNEKTEVFRNGMKIHVELYSIPVFNNNGEFQSGIISVHEIAELIKKDLEIKIQKERLEAIINSMSDGLILVNSSHDITFLNTAGKKFFHLPQYIKKTGDSLANNTYRYGTDGDIIPHADLPEERILKEGCFQNYVLTIERPDEKIHVSINGSPVYYRDGVIKEAILCIRDITEQVNQEQIILEHQKNTLLSEREKNDALQKAIEMKDEFLSTISHEFKTPLAVINSALQAMELICKNELSDRAKGFLHKIRQNSYRQLRLVNNLLDITKINAGYIKVNKRNMDIVYLTRAIFESVQLYASQKKIHLTFVSLIPDRIIGIDDEVYERILLNLLSNAIKFTPVGKSIELLIREDKDTIVVEVSDTGVGIPKDKREMIFERFGQVDSTFTRQAEGTGIGLSLVKNLVEALDGQITLKSKENRGSTFTIVLPVETVKTEPDKELDVKVNSRLVQATKVEFSDIYID
ncbi:MAG: hypothetical protein BGN88_04420 [Clostridiales bacterium 43-6]|nr:MAG: hypothetical protein BGN88_04420 [Clostridiales bacterium 43-6]